MGLEEFTKPVYESTFTKCTEEMSFANSVTVGNCAYFGSLFRTRRDLHPPQGLPAVFSGYFQASKTRRKALIGPVRKTEIT